MLISTSLRFVSADVLIQAVTVSLAAHEHEANSTSSAHTQPKRTSQSLSAILKPRERNKRKMLTRTARAAPRLLRTAHRHKAPRS